jgi:ethanolamine utilization protein EutN
MIGQKLLVVEPVRLNEKQRDQLVGTGRTLVAVDALGTGPGELVLICQGSSARLTPETAELPIDAVVIGIVDSVGIGDRNIYESGEEVQG